MAESKFERQLKSLIGSVESDGDSGEEDAEDNQVHDMTPVVFESKPTGIVLDDNKDLLEDYTFARSNLYGLIGRSNAAIELSIKIAAMSEHPRSMEVAASIMKTSADMTKQLLELHKAVTDNKKSPESKKVPDGHYEQHNHYYNPDDKNSNQIDGELDEMDDT